jgi:hypothetical protein
MNTTPAPQTDAYIPGVCNINHAEIAYRKKAGYLGVALFVVILAVMLALSVNRYARLALFIPAFLAAIGFLQAKNRFCVGYGAAGQQNASDGSPKASSVTDTAAVATDKRRARQMNLQAAGIAAVAALVCVLIPTF